MENLNFLNIIEKKSDNKAVWRVRLMRDKSSGRRMSLNRSQYGGCSTGLQHPDRYLGRLRDDFSPPRLSGVWPEAGKGSFRNITANTQGSISVACYGSAVKLSVSLPNNKEAPRYRCRSGRDTDLEAFSHSPTDGSFAPLAARPSTCAKCPNLRFLSYWAGLPLQQPVISRVKLTCLTTV